MWPLRNPSRALGSLRSKRTVAYSGLLLLVFAALPAARILAQDLQPRTPQISPGRVPLPSADGMVGAGDLVEVRVFDVPELSASYRVSGDGQLDLPLIGKLQVTGLAASQLAAQIEAKYKQNGFVVDPQVTVRVLEVATGGVTIEGEVKNAGNFPVFGPRSLSDILALAGGMTPTADTTIQIKHRSEGTFELVQMPTTGIRSVKAQTTLVLPGDIVFVPKAGVVYVLGQVTRPGGIIMKDNGHLSTLQALSEAQGLTKVAAPKNAFVLRKDGEQYTRIPLDLRPYLKGKEGDVELQTDDVLVVPASDVKVFFQDSAVLIAGLGGATLYAIAAR